MTIMVGHLVSPWVDSFDRVVSEALNSLVICSPYVGDQPCQRIVRLLSGKRKRDVSLFVLTNLSRENMLSGATDVGALMRLCEACPETEVRFLPNLHAKVYIVDENHAVVTSANLTQSGLSKNLEYGVYFSERRIVRRVRDDIMAYGSLGSVVPLSQLRIFDHVIAELRAVREKTERSVRARLRKEFEKKVREADEEILRARVVGLTSHATFSDTILWILRKGAHTTKSIHSMIQAIHPDLCDDSIKLFIKGEVWTQAKWRHKVRHAQLFLKRQGRIMREKNKWRVVV